MIFLVNVSPTSIPLLAQLSPPLTFPNIEIMTNRINHVSNASFTRSRSTFNVQHLTGIKVIYVYILIFLNLLICLYFLSGHDNGPHPCYKRETVGSFFMTPPSLQTQVGGAVFYYYYYGVAIQTRRREKGGETRATDNGARDASASRAQVCFFFRLLKFLLMVIIYNIDYS